MINDIEKLQLENSKKSKKKLERLPPLKLSPVFSDGLVYGVCYKDGHGNLEAVELMANQPEQLLEWAQENLKDYLDKTLYIIGFKPETIVFEVSS